MDKLGIAKAKELRGEIVRQLYDRYGSPVPVSSIHTLLRYKGYYSAEDIQRAILYLSGEKKEFVAVRSNEEDKGASFVSLTPVGVNLAEGDISDIGVLLNG